MNPVCRIEDILFRKEGVGVYGNGRKEINTSKLKEMTNRKKNTRVASRHLFHVMFSASLHIQIMHLHAYTRHISF